MIPNAIDLAEKNGRHTHTHTHTHTLHPACIVTRCNSLVPLGGPALCGLNRRPYFACRNALHTHIQKLAEYCEHAWTAKVGMHRTHALRSYAYRPRKSAQEVEDHRLHRALQGNL